MKRVECKGISCVWANDDLNFWQWYEFNTWAEALDFVRENRKNMKQWYIQTVALK